MSVIDHTVAFTLWFFLRFWARFLNHGHRTRQEDLSVVSGTSWARFLQQIAQAKRALLVQPRAQIRLLQITTLNKASDLLYGERSVLLAVFANDNVRAGGHLNWVKTGVPARQAPDLRG